MFWKIRACAQGETRYSGNARAFYKSSEIFLCQRSYADPVTVRMEGLPPRFRKWSIIAFALESIAVILAFLFMVIFLRWKINATLMYILVLVMVISAILLLASGRTSAGK
jgi:hypothetical protein